MNDIFIPHSEIERQYEIAYSLASETKGKKACVITFGCQQNENDGERIMGALALCGYEITQNPDEAQMIIINTCAIREHAEIRALSEAGQFKGRKERDRSIKIGLCGCMAQQSHRREQIYKSYPYVDFVFGTDMHHRLPEIIKTALSAKKRFSFITEKPHNGGGDRLTLRLCAEEVALIKGLKQAGKRVIVCLFSGSAVLIDEWKDYADAVIMHYYGGCEGGTAPANLLSGKVNFSGKLPFTVAQKESDYPEFKYIGQHPYTIDYGYYHGYTKLDKEGKAAAYPFGYGLSYTSFEISDVTVARSEKDLTVTATVKNTGKRAGAEVVQVYVGSKGAANGDDRPVKQLKGFKRVELQPGQEKTVEIAVSKEEMKFWTPSGWVLDDAYTVYVGANCANAKAV